MTVLRVACILSWINPDLKVNLEFLETHLIDPPSFSKRANSSHVGSSTPAAMKAIPSEKKEKVVHLINK